MISNRLKELRKELNKTQPEIAKKIGVAPTTYASWEQGTREPDIETITKLSNIFSVSIDYLLGKTNNRLANDVKSVDLGDDMVIKTFEGKEIPPEDMELIKRLLRGKD